MKRSWIGPALSIVVTALGLGHGLGCGNPCEGARDRITKRYEECGFEIAEDPEAEGKSGEIVCSEPDATKLDCLADCAESATCEALHGEGQPAVDFGRCNGDCTN